MFNIGELSAFFLKSHKSLKKPISAKHFNGNHRISRQPFIAKTITG